MYIRPHGHRPDKERAELRAEVHEALGVRGHSGRLRFRGPDGGLRLFHGDPALPRRRAAGRRGVRGPRREDSGGAPGLELGLPILPRSRNRGMPDPFFAVQARALPGRSGPGGRDLEGNPGGDAGELYVGPLVQDSLTEFTTPWFSYTFDIARKKYKYIRRLEKAIDKGHATCLSNH